MTRIFRQNVERRVFTEAQSISGQKRIVITCIVRADDREDLTLLAHRLACDRGVLTNVLFPCRELHEPGGIAHFFYMRAKKDATR